MNKRKLESVMKLYGDVDRTLAEYIGVARSTFSAKKNETRGAEFTQKEMILIKQRYNLTSAEMDENFFTQ